MEREDDILQRAIDQYKNEPIPAEPPREVVDATLAKLGEAARATPASVKERNVHVFGLTARFAAAAAILIFVGYAVGRLSAPQLPDIQELREALAASIEPAVREKVVADLNRQLQSTLEANYVALREDITQQYRSDLQQAAVQTLAASNAMTHRLLEDLLESINGQQMQWYAASLAELDRAHRQENAQLADAFAHVAAAAAATEGERTKEDIINMLSGGSDRTSTPAHYNSQTTN